MRYRDRPYDGANTLYRDVVAYLAAYPGVPEGLDTVLEGALYAEDARGMVQELCDAVNGALEEEPHEELDAMRGSERQVELQPLAELQIWGHSGTPRCHQRGHARLAARMAIRVIYPGRWW